MAKLGTRSSLSPRCLSALCTALKGLRAACDSQGGASSSLVRCLTLSFRLCAACAQPEEGRDLAPLAPGIKEAFKRAKECLLPALKDLYARARREDGHVDIAGKARKLRHTH